MGINISDVQMRNVGFGGVSDLPQVLTWQVSPSSVWPCTATLSPHYCNASQKWGGSAPRGFPAAYVGGGVTGEDATCPWADEHNRQLFLHDLQDQLDCCLL